MHTKYSRTKASQTKRFARGVAALALASGLAGMAAPQALAAPLAPHTLRAVTSGADDVTLDFVGADINDVLKALAMQTHTNIVSGNDVKGPITVSLAHVSLEEALDLITKLSGYQYAKVGRTYLVGTPAAVLALTASGTAQAPATTGVISFTYSNVDDLGNVVKQLFPNVKTTPGKSNGSSSGGVLIVTGPQADIDSIRRVVSDAESQLSRNVQGSRTQVYNIKYAAADDLQLVLARLVPGVIVTPGPVQRTYAPAPVTADAGGSTSSTTSYGAATPTGGTTTSVTGSVPVKPTTTSLLLTGADADIARALQVLGTVDQRPLQINYEARVIETNLNNDNELGLTHDFTAAHTTIGELLNPGETAASTTFADPFPGKILKFRTFGRTPISAFDTVQLHALFNSSNSKLLASPNISAVDGQPAATFVGDTVSYISSVTQSPTGQNITTSTVNAGIKLFVTGKVNNDGYITMNVHPEVSLVQLGQAGAGGVQVPLIHIREATTTVRVKDGETLVISGLINDQDVKSVTKVPFLGDIPFFGQLFRDTRRQHTHDQVMIFIKVSIQKDPVEASAAVPGAPAR